MKVDRRPATRTVPWHINNGTRRRILWMLAATMLVALIILARSQAPAGIPGVVPPGVSAELVQDGFGFLEGPVGTADGDLYFTDLFSSVGHPWT